MAHEDQPVEREGASLEEADALLIVLHGREQSIEDLLVIGRDLELPGLAVAAPVAEEESWYPYSFLVPVQQNEPDISSALTVIGSLVTEAELHEIESNRVMILGFSQGACLALEFAARNPARYGGVYALSGGLIGPAGTTWDAPEKLAGTPIFIGCGETDAHVPTYRVEESKEVLAGMGGDVKLKLYPSLGHAMGRDEIATVKEMIKAAAAHD